MTPGSGAAKASSRMPAPRTKVFAMLSLLSLAGDDVLRR
jgi:hypothetical protein